MSEQRRVRITVEGTVTGDEMPQAYQIPHLQCADIWEVRAAVVTSVETLPEPLSAEQALVEIRERVLRNGHAAYVTDDVLAILDRVHPPIRGEPT